MNVETALRQGIKLLEDAHVPAPRLTAEVLLSCALHQSRTFLYAHPEHDLSEIAWIHYGRYLHQRLSGMPTQYITKVQEFYGRDFRVSPDVLIPRPETENLVTEALAYIERGSTVLDVGTGSGAIAVTLSLNSEATKVLATDVSLEALRVARDNAARLSASVRFVNCDLMTAIADHSVDVLVSNPPYVGLNEADGLQREVRDFEPHVALFAGSDGLSLYRAVVDDAPRVLKPGGWLLLELGWKSLDGVTAMLNSGWNRVKAMPDLAGIPRVLRARLT